MNNQNPKDKRIRLGFISKDSTLAEIISSTVGPDFLPTRAFDVAGALDLATQQAVDLLLLDFDSLFPDELTSAAVESLLDCGTPMVLMANETNRTRVSSLVERGAFGYVRKPPAVRELRLMLRSGYERQRLRNELQLAQRQLEGIGGLDALTGCSAPMQLVYKLIRKVTNLEASVLINGESGTGKELIARAIHNTGDRSKRPFVAVSCGAIPESLIEAELFGHEKGSFTGAVGAREGYFEKAGDGTLFLDEIGELTPSTQVKLLRVIQQKEFSRVGSSRTTPLRARIVLATHRDLSHMVDEGSFRRDLFHRITVITITAPPLRERPEDIPGLVQHFLAHYAASCGKHISAVEPDALTLLQNYSWPGNVRELENVIQRAIILTEDDLIHVVDLPETIQELERHDLEALPSGSFERLLRDYKIKLAHDAVHQCNGNKTLAAHSLSISRAYLHRLIRAEVREPNTEHDLRVQ